LYIASLINAQIVQVDWLLWSRGVARWFRWSLSVADPFVRRCLTSSAMLPFPHPAHRTGRADLPHPALGEDSRNRRGHCMWRRLQLLKTTWELSGSSPISLSSSLLASAFNWGAE